MSKREEVTEQEVDAAKEEDNRKKRAWHHVCLARILRGGTACSERSCNTVNIMTENCEWQTKRTSEW